MKERQLERFCECAKQFAKLSYSQRTQVGCIIVKDDAIISVGYNGTPEGWDNCCEYSCLENQERVWSEEDKYVLVTKPEVIHAEMNAIGKLAKSNMSAQGAMSISTHSPCFECAKLLYIAGISKVVYLEEYRDLSGIKFLEKCGIEVIKRETNDTE